MNRVFLIGNLTRDPEMRSTPSGLQVCHFSIAVNRRRRADGNQETDFFNVVAWRQLAEICGKYLAKGRKVAVVGSIQTRTFEGQDGIKRNSVEIVADDVEFLSSQNQGASSAEYHPAAAPAAPVAPAPSFPTPEPEFSTVTVDDDELPF